MAPLSIVPTRETGYHRRTSTLLQPGTKWPRKLSRTTDPEDPDEYRAPGSGPQSDVRILNAALPKERTSLQTSSCSPALRTSTRCSTSTRGRPPRSWTPRSPSGPASQCGVPSCRERLRVPAGKTKSLATTNCPSHIRLSTPPPWKNTRASPCLRFVRSRAQSSPPVAGGRGHIRSLDGYSMLSGSRNHTGRWTLNTDPCFSLLSTVMAPPQLPTMSLQMDSPRPLRSLPFLVV